MPGSMWALARMTFGVAGADAVDVAQGDIDALVGRDFHADDTSHIKSKLSSY